MVLLNVFVHSEPILPHHFMIFTHEHSKYKRIFAALETQFNPALFPINVLNDVQFSDVILQFSLYCC